MKFNPKKGWFPLILFHPIYCHFTTQNNVLYLPHSNGVDLRRQERRWLPDYTWCSFFEAQVFVWSRDTCTTVIMCVWNKIQALTSLQIWVPRPFLSRAIDDRFERFSCCSNKIPIWLLGWLRPNRKVALQKLHLKSKNAFDRVTLLLMPFNKSFRVLNRCMWSKSEMLESFPWHLLNADFTQLSAIFKL